VNNKDQFVVMTGNLSDGYHAVGPYNSFDEASSAHEYEECWIMSLDAPRINEKAAEVYDIFNYQENWKNRP